ncbi:MAG: NAD(P)H-hydrate dehydratase [Caldisphaeraceae archaeon]|nr:NAD(P)H-hydrate dehydratase [Caldisphaeraceae archaeon]
MVRLICPGFIENPEILSVEDIKAYEINNVWHGLPLLNLMENAGRAVADAIECKLGKVKGKRIVIFAGKGGNGGDAIVAGRHLSSRGANILIYLLYDPNSIEHKDTQLNLNFLRKSSNVEIKHLSDPRDYSPLEADALIDGVFGIGIKGKIREPAFSALKAFNESKGYRVSVDVPSGVDPDTGEVAEGSAIADLTVTMQAIKPGLLKENASQYVGELLVAEIGMIKDSETYAGPGDVISRIPKRPKDAKKGGNGRVLTIGGSYHYLGAPYYASSSALLSGADLSFLASPEKVAYAVSQNNPGIIPIPLKGDYISKESIGLLKREVTRADTIIIGPGLGTSDETKEAVIEFIESVRGKPLIIDADALKALAEREIKLWESVVLTPHRGEASLLAKKDGDPQDLSKEIARRYSCTVIVKAPVDVICEPSGSCRYNKTGVPSMAVGGTGDVLTGVIGGFLARKVALENKAKPLHIVSAAAYVVGRAGELAFKEKGENITAIDVMQKIRDAIKEAWEYGR